MDDDWDLDVDALDQLAALEQQALAQRQQAVQQPQKTPWLAPGPAAVGSYPASHGQQWQQQHFPHHHQQQHQQQPWQGASSAQHNLQGAEPTSGRALPQGLTRSLVHQRQEFHRPQPLANPGPNLYATKPSMRPLADIMGPKQQRSVQAGHSWKPHQPMAHHSGTAQQQQPSWQRQEPQQQAKQEVQWQPAQQNAAHASIATGPHFASQNGRISGGGANVGSVQQPPFAAQAQPQPKQQQGKPNSAPSQLKQASLYSLWSNRTVALLPSGAGAGAGAGRGSSGSGGSAAAAQLGQHALAPGPAAGRQQQQHGSGDYQQGRAGLGSVPSSGPSSFGLPPARPPHQQQHQQGQPAWQRNPGSGGHPGCQPMEAAAQFATAAGAMRALTAPVQQPSGRHLPAPQQHAVPRPQEHQAAVTWNLEPSAGGCGTAAQCAALHDVRQAAGAALPAGWHAPGPRHGATAGNASGQQQQWQQEVQYVAQHPQHGQGDVSIAAEPVLSGSGASAPAAGEPRQRLPQEQQPHGHARLAEDVIDLCDDAAQGVGGGAAAPHQHQPESELQQQQQQQPCTAGRQQQQQEEERHQQQPLQHQLPADGQSGDWADFPSVSPGLWETPNNNNATAAAGMPAATALHNPQERTPAAAAARPSWQEAGVSEGAAAAAAAARAMQDGEGVCEPGFAGVEGGADGLAATEGGEAGYLVDCRTTSGGIQLHSFNARHWVYPKGVQERRYQLSCIETALLHNTLVCLPTGLGKTLIAAVVMHNFTRWFPQGKVVFVAPTRPLVNQQIDACYSFMGVSKTAMAELTGTVKQEERQRLWQQDHMRIYFATPQTFYNDVKKGICPYEKVVCLIVDECHRATGNYDIVNAVKHMRQHKCKFRVVGLSATPGSDASKVQEVIDNLMICRVEHRTESDSEVVPHVHQKDIHVEIVEPTREVELLRQSLLQLLRQVVGQLAGSRVYQGTSDAERVSRYMLLSQRNAYQERGGQVNYGVMQLFQQGMFLADLRDQMDLYGLSQALTYLNLKLADNGGAKKLVTNPIFGQFRQQLEGCVRACAQSPKMKKLVEVLRAHFQDGAMEPGSVGRVIIFTNLRESVNEIVESLKAHEPLITARMFIGQGGGAGKSGGAGMRQKEQKAVLTDFRAAKFNVLVATSIGEEGLDIPQVDLIVCYDATASPTRAIQRMGRTGRHREGRVVYILAAGREAEKYNSIEESMRQLNQKLAAAEHFFNLYSPNPRMLPREITPRRLDVAVQHLTPEKGAGEGKGSGRGRGAGKASGRGRGSGRGSKAAAAAVDGCGGADAGYGGEGAQSNEGPGEAAAGDSGRGRGTKRARAASGRGRGRGRAAKPAEPIVIDDEEDGYSAHQPAAPNRTAGAGPDRICAAHPAEQHAAQPAQHRQEEMGAGILEGPCWSDADMPDMPTPPSPVLGLLGEQPAQGREAQHAPEGTALTAGAAAPGHAELQEGRGDATRHCDIGEDELQPHNSGFQPTPAPGTAAQLQGKHHHHQQQQLLQEEEGPRELQLFPESAAVLSWDPAGQLTIAPPPSLEALLHRARAAEQQAAADLEGLASKAEDQGRTAPVKGSPGPGAAQPPTGSEKGLHVGCEVVVGLQDASAHRWAFVAAVGAPQHGGRHPSEASPGAAAEGGHAVAGADHLEAGKEPVEAAAKPSGAAGKKSSKAAPAKPSKPRKRKAKAPAPAPDSAPAGQQAAGPGAGADQPPLQPDSMKLAAAATVALAGAAPSAGEQQKQQEQAPLPGGCYLQQVPVPAVPSLMPSAGLPAAGPVAGTSCEGAVHPGRAVVAGQPARKTSASGVVVYVHQTSPHAVQQQVHPEPPLSGAADLTSDPEEGALAPPSEGQQLLGEEASHCAAADPDSEPSASQLPLRARLLLRAQQALQKQPGGGAETRRTEQIPLAERRSGDAVPAVQPFSDSQQAPAAAQKGLSTAAGLSLKPGAPVANKENRASSLRGDGIAGAASGAVDSGGGDGGLRMSQVPLTKRRSLALGGTTADAGQQQQQQQHHHHHQDLSGSMALPPPHSSPDLPREASGSPSQLPLSLRRQELQASRQPPPPVGAGQQQAACIEDITSAGVEGLQQQQGQRDGEADGRVPGREGSDEEQLPLAKRRARLQSQRNTATTAAGMPTSPSQPGPNTEAAAQASAAVLALAAQPLLPSAGSSEQAVPPAPVSKWASSTGHHAWQGGLNTYSWHGRQVQQKREREQPAGPPAAGPPEQQQPAASPLSEGSWEVSGEAEEEELPLGRRRRKLRKKRRRSPGGPQEPGHCMAGPAAAGKGSCYAAVAPAAQPAEPSLAGQDIVHPGPAQGFNSWAAITNGTGCASPAQEGQSLAPQLEQQQAKNHSSGSTARGMAQDAKEAFDYLDDLHDPDLGWDDHEAYCPGNSLAASWHAQQAGTLADGSPPRASFEQLRRVGRKEPPMQRAEQRQQAQQDPFSFASASPWSSEEDPWSEEQEPQATPRLAAPFFQAPAAGSRPTATAAVAAAATARAAASPFPGLGHPAAGMAAQQPAASAPGAAVPRQHAGPAATPLPRHPIAGLTHGGPAPSPAYSSQPLQFAQHRVGAGGRLAVTSSQTPLAGPLAWQAALAVRGRVLEDTPASDAGVEPPGESQASPEWGVPGARGAAAAGVRRGPTIGDTPEALAGAAPAAGKAAGEQATEQQQQQQPARKRLKKAGGQQQQQQQQRRREHRVERKEVGHSRGRQPKQAGMQEMQQKQKRKASRFIDMEAGVSEDEQVSGDEEEGDEDGFLEGFIDDATQAPPSTGDRPGSMGAYRQPLFGRPGEGPSPSPLGQLRSMLAKGRQARGGRQVQDTPGASGGGGVDGSQDDYDYDDSFLATEEGVTEGGYDSDGGSHEAACAVCRGEEGELLLCEGCPAVYHPACCGLRSVPEGDWFCPLCRSDRPTPRPGRQIKPKRHRAPPQSTARGGAVVAAERKQGQQQHQQQQQQQKARPGQQQQQQQARLALEPCGGHAGSGSGGAKTGDWDDGGENEAVEEEEEGYSVGLSGQEELSNTFSLL